MGFWNKLKGFLGLPTQQNKDLVEAKQLIAEAEVMDFSLMLQNGGVLIFTLSGRILLYVSAICMLIRPRASLFGLLWVLVRACI